MAERRSRAGPSADTLLGGFDFKNSGDRAVLAKFEAFSGNDYGVDDLVRDDDTGEVPEPASLALLGAGLTAMAVRRRRR